MATTDLQPTGGGQPNAVFHRMLSGLCAEHFTVYSEMEKKITVKKCCTGLSFLLLQLSMFYHT
jgi:hypothetical protein